MQRNLGFTPNRVLKSLFQLRFIAILAQLAVVAYAETQLRMELPLTPLLWLIGALAVWNLLTWWRLRPTIAEHWAPTAVEASVHLIVDITVLSGLLYWAGGPTNPFVSLYLVPIAIAATALPAMHAWTLTALCVTAYSLLLWKHVPLPHAHGHGGSDFNLHVLGMWANFILSALLIAAFVTLLATAVRRRDQALGQQREEALRNEQILALGTQAAGTAHELNTPLATMSILVNELRDNTGDKTQAAEDLDTLAGQISICRDRIRELVEQVSAPRSSAARPATDVMDDVIERWSLLRPETHVEQRRDADIHNISVSSDPALVQAIINLLANAADASAEQGSQHIELHASRAEDQLQLDINDHGQGLSEAQQALAGDAFFTTKPTGLGMGLVLSNATLERLGGQVTLENRPGGGTQARVLIPIESTRND